METSNLLDAEFKTLLILMLNELSENLNSIKEDQSEMKDTLTEMKNNCPDWYGSIGWALSCKAKGHWFNSLSGHMPGMQVHAWSGCIQEATDHCFPLISMFLSLTFSLPSPLTL